MRARMCVCECYLCVCATGVCSSVMCMCACVCVRAHACVCVKTFFSTVLHHTRSDVLSSSLFTFNNPATINIAMAGINPNSYRQYKQCLQ